MNLMHNITATCPASFGGTSGSVFAGAIAAVIAAHCAIFDDYTWPRDRAEDIFAQTDQVSYDFIVVGAGTAGSLVAGQLAELHPSWSVLLVEAGGDPGLDSEIPAFVFHNQNTHVDWQFKTNPDDRSCLSFENHSCSWNKGKALGGSSSINAMLYLRGHPKDFDDWEAEGNLGWGYNDLISYFEELEHELELKEYKYNKNSMYHIIAKAWKELGFGKHDRKSNVAKEGWRLTKLLINRGKRLNTAKIYLTDNDNLYVMKNTLVRKVLIDKETKIATGIIVQRKGVVMQIKVKREVILSAGSIATPQILMLSGIGPKAHLIEKHIQCIRDLAVGQNLQDHVLLPLFLKTNIKQTLSTGTVAIMLLQYMLSKTGPLAQIGVIDFMGFIDTKNTSYPDVQFHHTYYTKKDEFALKPYLITLGYKKEIRNIIEKLNEESDTLGIFPTLLHPKSKGEILLKDNDPESKPVIKANYFQHDTDIATLLNSIKFIHALEKTESFNNFEIKLAALHIPDCISFLNSPILYWKCYIKHMATTTYHPVGSVKMGAKDDITAVVDNNLLVHGVTKLRVVDASVMPKITGGNTMAPTLVIAKKAVDIIGKTYSGMKDEL